jgi:diaminopimelate epimerase
MTVLRLSKHHGLGNDFLVLLDLAGDTPIDAAMARAVCDRRRGIGADGLIRGTRLEAEARAAESGAAESGAAESGATESGAAESGAAESGDEPLALLRFELRNADGSEAEMSGNGMRCLVQAALDAGVVPADHPFLVLTAAGCRQVTVRRTEKSGVVWAAVEMGIAKIEGEADRCNIGHGDIKVDMGNPHLVVLGPDPSVVNVERLGPELERSVPGGQNVEFIALGPGPDEITMRVWERGVGETLACGTGASAAAAAMHYWGRVGRRVTVHQPGGDADVELREDGSVVLCGPSERIATCVVYPGVVSP